MNLNQLYETIILRDVLQYTLPGSVFFTGFILLFEAISKRLNVGFSIIGSVFDFPEFSLLFITVFAGISYIFGHILSGLALLLPNSDKFYGFEVLNQSKLLRDRFALAASYYLEIPKKDVEKMIKDNTEANELANFAITFEHHAMDDVYKETIALFSILARFCQSTAISIIFLLVFMLIVTVVEWRDVVVFAGANSPLLIMFSVLTVLFSVYIVKILFDRANRFRRSRFTAAIKLLYVLYKEEKTGNKNR